MHFGPTGVTPETFFIDFEDTPMNILANARKEKRRGAGHVAERVESRRRKCGRTKEAKPCEHSCFKNLPLPICLAWTGVNPIKGWNGDMPMRGRGLEAGCQEGLSAEDHPELARFLSLDLPAMQFSHTAMAQDYRVV